MTDRPEEDRMFIVIVTFDARPERTEEFAAAVEENARLSVEREPGCLVFDVSRSTDVPGRFHLYEVYVDEDAFQLDHKGSEHYADFVTVSTPLVVPGSKQVISAVRTVSAQKGATLDA